MDEVFNFKILGLLWCHGDENEKAALLLKLIDTAQIGTIDRSNFHLKIGC